MREWPETSPTTRPPKEQVAARARQDPTAKAALEYGLVDQVLESRTAPAAQITQ